jgi:hypothetical protein
MSSNLRPLPGKRSHARREFPDLEVIERRRAADGFVKYLFRLPDGARSRPCAFRCPIRWTPAL